MSIEDRVRRIYERRPYPPPSLRDLKSRWLPIEWIDAVRESSSPLAPKRVLVAGCGVGIEAFALARRFPNAEIVGVDFSGRSIATARRLQRKRREPAIRFVVADISGPRLPETAPGRFDLITCHGVLSYVPDIHGVLLNFARMLAPDGVLVVGVNGAAHPSIRYRQELKRFGIDPRELRDGARIRSILRVFDSLSDHSLPISDLPAGYLAGDIFGPLNWSLPLSEWSRLLRAARLHLRGSLGAFFAARAVVNRELTPMLMPRSRAEIAVLIDRLHPATFHQLVVTRTAPSRVPWDEPRRLSHWHPSFTRLYRVNWPRGAVQPSSRRLRTVRLESRAANTAVELRIPQWEVDLLRRADGTQTLQSLLGRRSSTVAEAVRETMYLLDQLCAMNVYPER